jgi:hypothetical protein
MGGYTDSKTKCLFVHCLLRANHKPQAWRGIIIPAGSFVTSYAHLAEENGMSVRNVRTSLKRLKSTNEVTSESTSQYSIITVVKWADYQSGEDDSDTPNDTQNDKQVTSERQASDKQVTTNKKVKNVENKIKNKDLFIADEREVWFDNFWTLYPKHIGRKTAHQKFMLHIKTETTYQAIINDLRTRTKSDAWTRDDGRYVPNPTTYLNQERWHDEQLDRVAHRGHIVPLPVYEVPEQLSEEEHLKLYNEVQEHIRKLKEKHL